MTIEGSDRVTPESIAILQAMRDISMTQFPTPEVARSLAFNLVASRHNYWESVLENSSNPILVQQAQSQVVILSEAEQLALDEDWSGIKRLLEQEAMNIDLESNPLPLEDRERLKTKYRQVASAI